MLVRCCAERGCFCKHSSASMSAETKALDPNSMPASMRRRCIGAGLIFSIHDDCQS